LSDRLKATTAAWSRPSRQRDWTDTPEQSRPETNSRSSASARARVIRQDPCESERMAEWGAGWISCTMCTVSIMRARARSSTKPAVARDGASRRTDTTAVGNAPARPDGAASSSTEQRASRAMRRAVEPRMSVRTGSCAAAPAYTRSAPRAETSRRIARAGSSSETSAISVLAPSEARADSMRSRTPAAEVWRVLTCSSVASAFSARASATTVSTWNSSQGEAPTQASTRPIRTHRSCASPAMGRSIPRRVQRSNSPIRPVGVLAQCIFPSSVRQ
jgi:hypothetical protein